MVFSSETGASTALTQLRLLRRKLDPKFVTDGPTRNAYQKLAQLVGMITDAYNRENPEANAWFSTPIDTEGWKFLMERGLSKAALKSLWDEELLELQQLHDGGWRYVFE